MNSHTTSVSNTGRVLIGQLDHILLAARGEYLRCVGNGQLSRCALRRLDREASIAHSLPGEVVSDFIPAMLREMRLVDVVQHRLRAREEAGEWLSSRTGIRWQDVFRAWLTSTEWREDSAFQAWGKAPIAPANYVRLREACVVHLQKHEPGAPFDAAEFVRELGLSEDMHPLLPTQMLGGPLTWLGIVDPVGSMWALSRAGQRILLGQTPQWDPPACNQWQIDHFPHIEIAGQPDMGLLFDLEAFSKCIARGESYVITPATVAQGLVVGLHAPRMIETLEAGLGEPIPEGAAARVREWGQEAGRVGFLQETVLEVREPELMQKLRGTRPIRRHLDRMLSPRHALVRPRRELRLARLLARRGFHSPLAELLDGPFRGARRLSWPWVAAGAVYAALSDLGDLPPLLSSHTLEAATRKLPPHEQRLVADFVRRATSSLFDTPESGDDAEEGERSEKGLPDSYGARLKMLAEIESAIQAQRRLRIVYDTAGRGAPQQRLIEPLLLEQYGMHTYVTAFCCQRQDQRVFRLDRIRAIEAAGDQCK